jgi:hypothetical protein
LKKRIGTRTRGTPDETRQSMLRDREHFDLAHWHGIGVSELLLQIRRAQVVPGIRQSFSRRHGITHLRLRRYD